MNLTPAQPNQDSAGLTADVLLLLAVLLPPVALDELGPVVAERTLTTTFGPVGPLALRKLPGGRGVWIAPYTGSATRTDPRATIAAAHALGVRQILNWDHCIALNHMVGRGQVGVIIDTIDYTRQPRTFAGAPPAQRLLPGVRRPSVCPRLTGLLHTAFPFAVDMIYLGIDGPRRETPAEARLFRQFGADVAGQNLTPERALAQEAGICYAGLVTVADVAADRVAPPPQGEVRAALHAVLSGLPHFLAHCAAPDGCDCLAVDADLPY